MFEDVEGAMLSMLVLIAASTACLNRIKREWRIKKSLVGKRTPKTI
jgi:hypothetical protein